MESVFFPFTHMAAALARSLAVCFETVVVYRPAASALAGGALKDPEGDLPPVVYRSPVTVDDARLGLLMKEYRGWVTLHGKDALTQMIRQRDQDRLLDETSVQRIRTEIRRQGSGGTGHSEKDPVMDALMFLILAETHDRETQDLAAELSEIGKMESALMQDLRDELDDGGSASVSRKNGFAADPGQRMTAQRIRAWGKLAGADPHLPETWVTSSPAVIGHIQDRIPGLRRLCRITGVPPVHPQSPEADDLHRFLDEALQKSPEGGGPCYAFQPSQSGGETLMDMTWYRLHGWSARALAAWTDHQTDAAIEEPGIEPTRSLRLVLIEPACG